MGLNPLTKLLIVCYFLVVHGDQEEAPHQSQRTPRSDNRGLSDPIGMLSDQLLSSSSLIHQLIRMRDDGPKFQRRILGNVSDTLDEDESSLLDDDNDNSIELTKSTTTTADSGPKSSALIDDNESDPFANDPYRWRPGSKMNEQQTSQPSPSDYSPEPFVYICRDPSKCRIPGTLSPHYGDKTSTTPVTHRKYGYRKVNATKTQDESEDKEDEDEESYKTIFRSQIRKVKKKRPGLRYKKQENEKLPDFKDMSLEELQKFMKHQSKKVINGLKPSSQKILENTMMNTPSPLSIVSTDPFDLMMKEIKKIHEHNQMKKSSTSRPLSQSTPEPMPHHRPMKPFVVRNPSTQQLSLEMMMKNLQAFSPSTSTSTRSSTTAFTVRPTFIPKTTPSTTTSKMPKIMSPFEIMLLRMKEKENQPQKSTAFTVRPTSTLRPKTSTTTTLRAEITTSSYIQRGTSTVFTVRPTSTTTSDPSTSTMSAFEMMVLRMKKKSTPSTQSTVFTVRPTTGSSQIINSQLADLGMSSLMKIMSDSGKKTSLFPSNMRPFTAVPGSTTSVNKFMHFKSKDMESTSVDEELKQDTEYDRPPRRPAHDPYYSQTETPFTVRPTELSGHHYHNGYYHRTTPASKPPLYNYPYYQGTTPFTVRPSGSPQYDGHYQHHRTTKKVPYQPYQELNYQVRSTTPFTVFGKKKSYLPTASSTEAPPSAAFKHDVELKDPFSYDGSSFMSAMKDLQQDSKPSYIPDAPTSSEEQQYISNKSFESGVGEDDPSLEDINPFKMHPFEDSEGGQEEVKSKFQAIHHSNYGHDDRPLMPSFYQEDKDETTEIEEENEDDYYDEFEQYDLEDLINKLSEEKGLNSNIENKEETLLPKLDYFEYGDHQLTEDISAPLINDFQVKSHTPFTVFNQMTTIGPQHIASFSNSKFPDFPKFEESSFDHGSSFETESGSTDQYFRPDGIFSNTKIKLEPGSLPDRPLVETVFRDLPSLKEPHPQFPSEVKGPPPPVPTTADFVSQYLKNPYGSNFIRMEIDQDKFNHNRTKPGSIHVPLMIKNYALHKVSLTTPKPVPKKHMKPNHGPRHPPPHPGKPKQRRPSNKKPNPPHSPQKRPSINPMKTILSDLKNLRKVMFNLPNAIQDLPSYMKGLVSNKASFAGRAFTDQDSVLDEEKKNEEKDEEKGEEKEEEETIKDETVSEKKDSAGDEEST